ncbi:hypothetical protein IEN85_21210 [Pelagicoccus sp. NFK12]|uniref:Uncharacterized protein n=1 Tax=Pelagicoccus enzymogenes TaxID=2773457 RepID=A0A927FBN6_9BACT|nr:hypothetical protein [Pelagicoccus enzymogenes]MBD5782032.1 hypothetical protein [Pelagicoccus enzymogenes]
MQTIEEAYDFIQKVGICTIFSESVPGIGSFYDAVDLPDRSGGRTKWGARMEAVWEWKIELPTLYPEDIYYGKIKGGHAALMSMRYFKEVHYPKHAYVVSACKPLAQQVYEIVRLSPGTTAEVRREAMERFGCSKSRFDTALKELQISLNIVRLNEPDLKNDTWVPFEEVYGELELGGGQEDDA